jgi:ribosomal protein L3 glutamine methyltransferase
MTVLELIARHAQQLQAAGVSFGHGTTNAQDEASWLVLWKLGLPLDSDLDVLAKTEVTASQASDVAILLEARINSRKPAAYLTQEAWLQGVPFYVDERVIVPRSLIAELLVQADTAANIDPWLSKHTARMLDLCTGNGSLAIICAMAFPDVQVDAADISADALAVADINVRRHDLLARVRLMCSDGLNAVAGPYDVILCNPPYVNARSMAQLPAEYLAEPELALAGGEDGMDFVRHLLRQAPTHMTPSAVLILEIGNEREYFEAAFPQLEVFWLETSAGEDQVLLVTREALLTCMNG